MNKDDLINILVDWVEKGKKTKVHIGTKSEGWACESSSAPKL